MEYTKFGGQKIPVAAEVDLFVAGGGCAGIGAALAAARAGITVFLAEQLFCLGGMMTSGLMSKIAISDRNNGIAKELLERLDAYQGTHFTGGRPEVPIDPELTKFMLDKMVVDEANAAVRFGTVVSDVITDGKRIHTVIIDSINGLEAVKAKYFVDSTGDGQLAFKAGASYAVGNEDGYSSSPTLMFRIANANIEKYLAAREAHPEEYTWERGRPCMTLEEQKYKLAHDEMVACHEFIPLIQRKIKEAPELFTDWDRVTLLNRGIGFMNQPQKGHVLVNSTRIPMFRGDNTRELSDAIVEGRKQCECIFKFLKTYIPGFEDSFILDTGNLLGIRESRRIAGDYVFTEQDVMSMARFDDAIVSNQGGLEIHQAKEMGTLYTHLPPGGYYNVPYRSIIAKDFDNLYAAGRCFSATHPALSAARNIAYCIALGQAAGTAAAQLVGAGRKNVRDVDIKDLQRELASII